MNVEKSSWKSFLNNKELMYVGSTFNKSVNEIVIAIDKLVAPEFKIDRIFVGGVTDLKFKRPDGEISHLSKRGNVYEYGDYILIHDVANESIIVYRVK